MAQKAETPNHLNLLTEKHAALEAEIDSETQHPAPDSVRLTDLKRQKLAIKDEIARLTRGSTRLADTFG